MDVSSGEEFMEASIGVGPVDATFKAIQQIVNRPVQLTNYTVTKIEGGSGPDAPGNDALASVVTHIKTGSEGAAAQASPSAPSGNELGVNKRGSASGITYTGVGTSTDIIVASARAYLSAINRAIAYEDKI